MIVLVFTLAILIYRFQGHAQDVEQEMFPETTFANAISTDPFLPLFSSFSVTYERKQGIKNGLIIGFWYGRAAATYPKEISYPGYLDNYSLILAYRRYFWKNLHAEYQTYQGFTRFYEEFSGKVTQSFSLFTEFRLGYKFEFQFLHKPLLLNFQWPVGITLYESNEPESFREVRKKDPVFYIIYPNIWLGFRF